MTAPAMHYSPLTRRGRLLSRLASLKSERASYDSHWREIGEFLKPRRSRFSVTDAGKGDRRTNKILDSTGSFALRTLSSGMMSGITSPARQWMRLTTPDPDLAELQEVKEWLHVVTQRLFSVLNRSNFYNSASLLYSDLGAFGTACKGIFEDDDKVIRCETYPIGSYMLGINAMGRPDTFARQFRMKVHQIVEQFGLAEGSRDYNNIDWSNISSGVKTAWEKGHFDSLYDVAYMITPNWGIHGTYNGVSVLAKDKRWHACYFELGSLDGDKLLEESGFDEFPIMAPRWETSAEDAYGNDCPGMMALADVKQLQHGERRGAQALDKMVTPPLTAPTSARRARISNLPGDVTYNDPRDQHTGIRAMYEVSISLRELEYKQDQKRQLINRAFLADLFLMLASNPNLDDGQKTAREIEERHEEKFLALGPVLESLNLDYLDPAVDRVFAIMERRGLIPEPPEVLADAILKVEYLSIMAQAQKMVGLGGLERTAQFAITLSREAQDPTILDKLDTDQLIDEHGEMTGVPPQVIRSDERVMEIRSARAKQQALAQEAAVMKDASQAAKNLAGADMEGNNALTALMRGVVAPGGVPDQMSPELEESIV